MDGTDRRSPSGIADPYVGKVVANVFRIDALIGMGTTGRVYRATQLGFERYVAIKILHRHLMQSASVRERFHREARLAPRLHHPGVVKVLASGELDRSDPFDGEAFLVFEFLEGNSLRNLLSERQPLPIARAVSLAVAAGDAVGEAHARRIVHRDLKPENLMLVPGPDGPPRLVVLDFGLARALDHEHDPLTRDGAVLGTPQYMSPEAASGQSATPQSDVYALATILYELLAGRPPFAAESPMVILMQKVDAEPPPLDALLAVPEALQQLLRSELARSPVSRSADARRFASRLFTTSTGAGIERSQLLSPQLSDEFLEQIAGI